MAAGAPDTRSTRYNFMGMMIPTKKGKNSVSSAEEQLIGSSSSGSPSLSPYGTQRPQGQRDANVDMSHHMVYSGAPSPPPSTVGYPYSIAEGNRETESIEVLDEMEISSTRNGSTHRGSNRS
ncbi:PREDICTED: uncharacterized protein LOC106808508 [Priapulus caudatus]|uniref:Uncharacterized protein LOC106808508 n=1 Tax=Priapulus caudatus TaxID=37621 RepID=A0ABM1E3H7_PRICU|nr:PREDICTED: uncharacterized protein LOC106808508 [Priapulus caudatus]